MPDTVGRVLLVEDNDADAALLRRALRRIRQGSVEVRHVARLADALDLLQAEVPDVMLLDLGLPDAHGLEGVRTVRTTAPGLPIVVLTGLDDEAVAAEALQEGAQDYLVKGDADGELVMRAIRYAVLRQRMRVEAERARAAQLALKDEFLSHVSHELRSPLAVIHQFATILQDGLAGELSAMQQEYLGIVVQNAEQLGAMIEDLLEITRAQVGKLTAEPQCVALGEVLHEAAACFAHRAEGKGIALHVEVAAGLPTVVADPRRVHQVLGNLLDNALKFTPEGGSIRLGAAACEEEPGTVRCHVADTGCGMSEEESRLVFERLYQVAGASVASRKGLGLGLYISKELVERMGGVMEVESAPGCGSVFAFTLPVLDVPALVEPLLAGLAQPPATLGVLEVAVAAGEGVRGDEWERIVREAHEVVHRCVLPDLDVLLPRVHARGSDRFLIVAAVEAAGTAVLARRLREQLGACDAALAGRVRHCVHVHTLPLEPWCDADGRARTVGGLAPRLERLMHPAVPEA